MCLRARACVPACACAAVQAHIGNATRTFACARGMHHGVGYVHVDAQVEAYANAYANANEDAIIIANANAY